MVLALTLLIGLPLTGGAAELVRATLRRMLPPAPTTAIAGHPQAVAPTH